MKKVVLSVLLASVINFAFAQKSEIAEAKKSWAMFQAFGASTSTPLAKKLSQLKDGIKHTDLAIADEKSKVMPEAWSYRALLASAIALSDTVNIKNADFYVKVATEAIDKAKSLDTKGTEKENINISQTNVTNAIKNIGVISYNRKDYKTAYDKFLQSTVINPSDTSMYLNAGIAARNMEDYPKLITMYKKTISFNHPQSEGLYTEIIDITLRKLKDTTAVLNLLKEASAKYPNNPEFIKSETQIYIDRGDIAKSEVMLNKLAEKEPNNPTYQILLGNIYFSQALKLQEERSKIERKKDPNDKQFNAVTAKMTALIDKSLPYYKKAVDVDPVNQAGLETLKTIYSFKSDTKNYEAIKKRLEALPKK